MTTRGPAQPEDSRIEFWECHDGRYICDIHLPKGGSHRIETNREHEGVFHTNSRGDRSQSAGTSQYRAKSLGQFRRDFIRAARSWASDEKPTPLPMDDIITISDDPDTHDTLAEGKGWEGVL